MDQYTSQDGEHFFDSMDWESTGGCDYDGEHFFDCLSE